MNPTAVDAFRLGFSPYFQRYTVGETGTLFDGTTWRTVHGRLNDNRIESALVGRLVLGYFSTTTPRALGIDIDDHNLLGTAYLLSVAEQVQRRFGGFPASVIATSPRGLHLWYFVVWPVAWSVLHDAAASRLDGIPAEVRPGPDVSLRIPAVGSFLDPETFKPDLRPIEDLIRNAQRYVPSVLFDADVLPADVRSSLQEKRARSARLRSSVFLAKAEAELYPIRAGATNEALTRLIPAYRGAGLSENEAVGRFVGLLSEEYRGELRNDRRLFARVRSFYRDAHHVVSKPPRERQLSLLNRAAAEAVASLYADRPRAVQVRKSIIRLVEGILNWHDYVAESLQVPLTRATWAWLYPFSIKNWTAGYTPLPRSVLVSIDSHYNRHMPFLLEAGFLTRSPYLYVPNGGICLYYRINPQILDSGQKRGVPICAPLSSEGGRK